MVAHKHFFCEGKRNGCPDSARFTVKQRARANQAIVICAFLLLLGAMGVLVWVSVSSRSDAIQLALSRRADAKQTAMEDALLAWARLADQVGRVMAVSPNTTIESFLFFLAGSSSELEVPELISVSWAVPVENNPDAIAAFEVYARQVTSCETATINYNPASNFSWRPPAVNQTDFLPFVQTTYGNSAAVACISGAIGFDLLAIDPSNSARRTSVLEAVKDRRALASTPVNTSGTLLEHLGIIQSVIAPIFVGDEFVGLVSAAFQATDLVAAGAAAVEEIGVYATLTDIESGMALSSDAPSDSFAWVEFRNLTFGGRTWQLEVVADVAFAEAVPNEAFWTSLLACILTAIVGALVLARVRDEAILAKATKRLLLQMSHDLRTPLHSIWHAAMEISNLPGMKNNAAATEPTETLKWCATLAKNILDNILDMSHISKGTLVVVDRPTNVLVSLATAVKIMRATAEDGGTQLEFQGQQSGPLCMVDSEKLIRVVLNVIGNAIKFTPGGLVQVNVSLSSAESDADSNNSNFVVAPKKKPQLLLKVAVQDNGCGMDAATLVTATRAYAHASRTHGGGSGIGLHVAKTIVEQYGGSLTLDSPGANLGSTVSFSMLLAGVSGADDASGHQDEDQCTARVHDDAQVATSKSGAVQLVRDHRHHADSSGSEVNNATASRQCVVLVVDDSRLNRRVAMHAVKSLEHVLVEECVDGIQALARLKSLAQDAPTCQVLCLMDQSMPKMGGDEATRRYREWAARTGIPREEQAWICVLTGDVVTTGGSNFRDPGFDHRLTKPCPAETLQSVLREQLGTQHARPPVPAASSTQTGSTDVAVPVESEDCIPPPEDSGDNLGNNSSSASAKQQVPPSWVLPVTT